METTQKIIVIILIIIAAIFILSVIFKLDSDIVDDVADIFDDLD